METVEKSNPDFSTVSTVLGNPATDAGFPHFPSHDDGGYPLPLKANPAKIAGPVRFLRRAQKIEDAGELCPERMKTIDDEILSNALAFLDKARKDNKPFFLWLNPTRMHVVTHLSDKYETCVLPRTDGQLKRLE